MRRDSCGGRYRAGLRQPRDRHHQWLSVPVADQLPRGWSECWRAQYHVQRHQQHHEAGAMKRILLPSRKHQRGAAAVEFALVAIVFFMLLIGIVEMGRVLFTWNATAEATRYGARVAVVCPPNDPAILTRMQKIMPALKDENVLVCYSDKFTGATGSGACLSTCSVSTCKQVSVGIQGVQI